jgi:hypothetical protein
MWLIFNVQNVQKFMIEFTGDELLEEVRAIFLQTYNPSETDPFTLYLNQTPLGTETQRLNTIYDIRDMSELTVTFRHSKPPAPAATPAAQFAKKDAPERVLTRKYSKQNLQMLLDIGFERQAAIAALNQANDDVNKAVKLLRGAADGADTEVTPEVEYQKLGRAQKAAIDRLRKTGRKLADVVAKYLECKKDEVRAREALLAQAPRV